MQSLTAGLTAKLANKSLVVKLVQRPGAVAPVCIFSHYQIQELKKKQGHSEFNFMFYTLPPDAS